MHTSTYRLYTSIKIALALMTAGSGSSVADPGHIADAGSDPCSCTDIWHTFYFVQLSKVKMGFQGGIWIRSLWCRSSQIRNPQKQFYTRRNTCQISITGMSRVAAKIFVFVDSPNFRTFFFLLNEISLDFRETGNQNLGNIFAFMRKRYDFWIFIMLKNYFFLHTMFIKSNGFWQFFIWGKEFFFFLSVADPDNFWPEPDPDP